MSSLLVKEVLKPALRTVDAIMSKFGVGKKDAQKFLNSKFKREQVKGGAKVAAVGGGLWAASNFMKAKLGVYPVVASGSGSKTSSVSKPTPKPKSYRTVGGYRLTEKQYLKYLDQGKDYLDKIKNTLKKVSGKKSNG